LRRAFRCKRRKARRRSRYGSVQGLLAAVCALALSALVAGIAATLLPLLRLLRLLHRLQRLLLRVCRHHRIDAEWQDAASELAGETADLRTQLRIAEHSADRAAERLTDLPDEIAEPTLRCELLLLCEVLLRQLLLHVCRGNGIDAERQHAAPDLSGDSADLRAQSCIAKHSTDGTTERLAHLADEIAEPALRCELLLKCLLLKCLLLKCLLLKCLLKSLLLCLLKGLLLCLLQRLLLRIGCRNRIGAERQNRSADATGGLADLSTECRITEDAADAASDQSAQRCADQSAEKSLGCKLLPIRGVTVSGVACKALHIFIHVEFLP
jgi:hypothetical protein